MTLAFNEAEASAAVSDDQDADQPDILGTVTVPAHRHAKDGRRPLPKAFPRVEVVHEIDDDDCQCAEYHSALTTISEKVTEQLDIQPARVLVLKRVRKTYACQAFDGKLVTAPIPAQPIPRCLASSGTQRARAVCRRFASGAAVHLNYRRAEVLKSDGLILFLFLNPVPGRPLLDSRHGVERCSVTRAKVTRKPLIEL